MQHLIPILLLQNIRQMLPHTHNGGTLIPGYGIRKALLGMGVVNQNLGSRTLLVNGHVPAGQRIHIQQVPANIGDAVHNIKSVAKRLIILQCRQIHDLLPNMRNKFCEGPSVCPTLRIHGLRDRRFLLRGRFPDIPAIFRQQTLQIQYHHALLLCALLVFHPHQFLQGQFRFLLPCNGLLMLLPHCHLSGLGLVEVARHPIPKTLLPEEQAFPVLPAFRLPCQHRHQFPDPLVPPRLQQAGKQTVLLRFSPPAHKGLPDQQQDAAYHYDGNYFIAFPAFDRPHPLSRFIPTTICVPGPGHSSMGLRAGSLTDIPKLC